MQTNSRIRTVPSSSEVVEFTPATPNETQLPYSEEVTTPGYTPLVEYYTPNSGGDRKAWKDFEHFKSVQTAMPMRGMKLATESGGYVPYHYVGNTSLPLVGYHAQTWGSVGEPYGDAGQLDSNLPVFYSPRDDGGFVAPPLDLQGLLKRGLRTMLPTMKPEMSAVNSILELKDLRILKRPVEKIITHFKSGQYRLDLLNLRLWLRSKGWQRLPPREVIRKSASSHLTWSFAVAPMISDYLAIKRVIERASGRINDLINRAGRRQSKHFRYVFTEFGDTYEETGNFGYWSWKYQHQTLQHCESSRRVIYKPTVFHAQLEYNYNYSSLQLAHSQLLGHLDALGVNLNPGIIWNAIPFSFVVDWLLGIGDYLDSLGVANMEPQINIHRLLWSIKRERSIVVTKKLVSPRFGYALYQEAQLGRVDQVAYRRNNANIDLSSCVEASGLTLREFSLGASLVVANSGRRRNRSRS